MIALVRYQLAELWHSQRYVPPALVHIGLLAVFCSTNQGPALPGYAVTAASSLVAACWLTIALAGLSGPEQRMIIAAHAGSSTRVLVGVVLTALSCSAGLAVLAVGWGAVTHDAHVPLTTLVLGLLVHLICSVFGVAVALPCSALVISRIGYTLVAAVVLLTVTLLAKWVPLAFPLLFALGADTAPPAVLVQAALTAVLLLVLTTALTAWRQDFGMSAQRTM
ncbi:hypothetical protein [Saccharopolyspora sp. NPDC049357]|uniref:hypothetical protein n=1 Tax=Saccharopolyspora sp. NPDC049357 TaxID=3154507 RepID=UPI0034270D16